MKNVIYYNAGAGSGKTYNLTHILAEEIRGGINPSEVILTTFTRRAADDLRQRARAVLYEYGLSEKAALLDQATIGTVHSIGEQFVGKFWYLLGLSPNMNIMDEIATEFYINRSLSELPTPEDIDFFRRFRHNFDLQRYDGMRNVPDLDFWKSWLREVINKATWYRVDDFVESTEKSIECLRTYYRPDHDFNKTFQDYHVALRIAKNADISATSQAATKRIEEINRFLKIRHPSFVDFATLGAFLAKLPVKTKKTIPEYDNIVAELQGIWHSNQVFNEISEAVRRIFDIASRWKTHYAEYKAQRRILDFNDMERYFNALLRMPECQQELRGRYRLLMVDEFQDSSPVQVDIFDRLSEMVEKSYWCGDSKQAIFGFRGSDTTLTKAVVDMIRAESPEAIRTLDTSYRSEPDIVEQCNAIFRCVFDGKLDENEVMLKKHREKESSGPSLMHWHSNLSKKEYLSANLVNNIQQLVLTYSIPYNEIAVLARSNSEIATITEALYRAGIPVNHPGLELSKCKEIELLSAILTLVINLDNPLAKARIAFLATQGFTLSEMIESRMAEREEVARYIKERGQASDPDSVERPISWLANDPLVSKVMAIRELWSNQGISAMIESIMVELNLRAVLKSWGGSWRQREENLYQYVALAQRYESYCQTMTLGASINGFLNWSKGVPALSCGDSQGVVLETYHRSKGLEWKNVILVSFDNDVTDQTDVIKREVFGIHEIRKAKPSRECLFPGMWISMVPNLFSGFKSVPADICMDVVSSVRYEECVRKVTDESARLLYVGMTRGRNRLITYTHAASMRGGDPFATFTNLGIKVDVETEEPEHDIFGTGLRVTLNPWRQLDKDEDPAAIPTTNRSVLYDLATDNTEASAYTPRYISPSNVRFHVATTISIAAQSDRCIPLRGNPAMDRVGTCIHNAYAAFTGDRVHDVKVVDDMKAGFGFQEVLPNSDAIVDAYTWLFDWLKDRYGAPTAVYHELPFMHSDCGCIVRGSMDLVYETQHGCVLVDFKTFPGKEADVTNAASKHYAGTYASQFLCYEEALLDAGKVMLASYVYYPVAGLVIEIDVRHLT